MRFRCCPFVRPARLFATALVFGVTACGTVRAQFQAATTVQLPEFGVSIDAEGVLSVKAYTDPDGRLHAARLAAARAALSADVAIPAAMRKVSLVRLEQALRGGIDAGEKPDDTMRHLAGLQRVQYVFYLPEQRDIVLAGPAEGWMEDASGRAIGLSTRRPVLLLEDLLVAVRTFSPGGRPKVQVGCSIDPSAEGLERMRKFQASVPSVIPQNQRDLAALRIAMGSRDALGMADVRVFGVPAETHFAQVMVEADYRMKLIAIGLEPPPVKMVTFLDAIGSAPKFTLQRWWFTPNYDCVRVTEDGLGMELVGEGVQLLGEDKLIAVDGSLAARPGPPNHASELFTTSFTKKYPDISARSAVFAQLRCLVDLLVASAFIRQQDYYGRAGWTAATLNDEAALPTRTHAVPKRVAAAVNCVWKGNRLLSPAGGGVDIRPEEALAADRLMRDEGGKLAQQWHQLSLPAAGERWWWD
jgi:hypothetical protein